MNNECLTIELPVLDDSAERPFDSQAAPGGSDTEWSWAVVDDMASRFTSSNSIARDFAGQCAERIKDLEFALLCSRISLDLWEARPDQEHPVAEVLRDLDAENRRHLRALVRIRERLAAFGTSESSGQHLKLSVAHCREQVRLRLFPKLIP